MPMPESAVRATREGGRRMMYSQGGKMIVRGKKFFYTR
jgi:hypothetical protein